MFKDIETSVLVNRVNCNVTVEIFLSRLSTIAFVNIYHLICNRGKHVTKQS